MIVSTNYDWVKKTLRACEINKREDFTSNVYFTFESIETGKIQIYVTSPFVPILMVWKFSLLVIQSHIKTMTESLAFTRLTSVTEESLKET